MGETYAAFVCTPTSPPGTKACKVAVSSSSNLRRQEGADLTRGDLSHALPLDMSDVFGSGDIELSDMQGGKVDFGSIHADLHPLVKPSPNKLPPAGTLSAEGLRLVGAPESIVQWAVEGVPLVWKKGAPPKCHYINRDPSCHIHQEFVNARVGEYVQAGAIKEVPVGFLHCCLPVKVVQSGATGKLRFIVAACFVNDYVVNPKFTYETLDAVATVLQQGDWMGKVDAASGYHSIPLHQDYWKYLGFSWEGKYYCFKVLVMGLCSAPFVYTMIMRQLTKFWRGLGVFLHQYLDDTWWRSATVKHWLFSAKLIIQTLYDCGFWLGLDKCGLIPMQLIEQVGVMIDSAHMTYALPVRRQQGIMQCLQQVLVAQGRVNLALMRELLGKLASAEICIYGCRVYLRAMYMEIKGLAVVGRADSFECVVCLSGGAMSEVQWWVQHLSGVCAKPITLKAAKLVITTDASDFAVGGWCSEGRECMQLLHDSEIHQGSTARELVGAIRIGTHLLLKSRKDQPWAVCQPKLGIFVVVEWRTDNWGAEQIVKWGSRNEHLNVLAKKLWDMAWEAGFVWRPRWVPREENVKADLLSKVQCWKVRMNPVAYQWLTTRRPVSATIHCFASHSTRLPQVLEVLDEEQWFTEVNFFDWHWGGNDLPILTPPYNQTAAVLAKVREVGHPALLVHPWWRGRPWWPLLQQLAVWSERPPMPAFCLLGRGELAGVVPIKLRVHSAISLLMP